MLGNRKTAGESPSPSTCSDFLNSLPLSFSLEQISGELSDLIGGDFDASFVTWLFDEVKNHYPEPAPAPSPAHQPSTSSSSAPSSGLPARPTQPGRMFGAAVSGVKRDSREMSEGGGGREQPPHQRQRFDRDGGAPSGPRNQNGGGKSLFDRMGGAKNAQFAPGPRNNAPLINSLGMPQAAFDAVSTIVPHQSDIYGILIWDKVLADHANDSGSQLWGSPFDSRNYPFPSTRRSPLILDTPSSRPRTSSSTRNGSSTSFCPNAERLEFFSRRIRTSSIWVQPSSRSFQPRVRSDATTATAKRWIPRRTSWSSTTTIPSSSTTKTETSSRTTEETRVGSDLQAWSRVHETYLWVLTP